MDVSLQSFRTITMVTVIATTFFHYFDFFLAQLLAVDVLKPLCECFSAFWQENLDNKTLEIRTFPSTAKNSSFVATLPCGAAEKESQLLKKLCAESTVVFYLQKII